MTRRLVQYEIDADSEDARKALSLLREMSIEYGRRRRQRAIGLILRAALLAITWAAIIALYWRD